ncbi:MAG: hypothetical protein LBS92_07395 [Candidatus Methanoplasma sp.]|jgi:hypothetical protein|nr:hypothetical protein [Candidatus Methanoplasma sp.]
MSKGKNHSEALHVFVVGLIPLALVALLVGVSVVVHSDDGAEAADVTNGIEVQAAWEEGGVSDEGVPLFLGAAIAFAALAIVGFSAVFRTGMRETA